MTIGISAVLLAISQTTAWGWASPKTVGLTLVGVAVIAAWIAVEVRSENPLVDMAMMRVRGVWTTNAAAFLLGAGLYASFIVFPQFAQLPTSTGFGFGASVVVSGLYLLPSTIGMTILGLKAGAISARFGSRAALLGGTVFSTASFLLLALAHSQPWEFLLAATLLGIGIGLAFAALGNLIVQAVPSHQTGVASGVNTVMRTLGGALGGQLSATFIAENMADGLPDRHRLHRDLPDGDRLPRPLLLHRPPGPEERSAAPTRARRPTSGRPPFPRGRRRERPRSR